MKMPDTKKERMLMFALIGVVVVVLLVVAVLWGLLPLLDTRRSLEASLESRREQMKKAKRELDYAPSLQKSFDEIVARTEKIRAENILRPILGSYLVGVSEQIESEARASMVRIEEIREVGVVNIPQKGKAPSEQTFKSFVVQVNGEGTYAALCRFLQRMEDRNPYFSVSEVTITGQSDSPELQRLSARMEWPIEPASEVKTRGTP